MIWKIRDKKTVDGSSQYTRSQVESKLSIRPRSPTIAVIPSVAKEIQLSTPGAGGSTLQKNRSRSHQ